jgi:hypothetical protein
MMMKKRSGGLWILKGLGIVGTLAGAAVAGTALMLRSWAKDPESEDLRVITGSGKGLKLTKTEDGKVVVDTHYDASLDPDMQEEDAEPRGPVLVLSAEEAAKKAEECCEEAGEKLEAAAEKLEECCEAAGKKAEECCEAASEKAEKCCETAGEKLEECCGEAGKKAEECCEAAAGKIDELGKEAGAAVDELIQELLKPEEETGE